MTEETDQTAEQGRDKTVMRRVTLGVVGLAIVLFFYYVLADRYTPFSSDARVQAFVLQVAPEVSGRISSVDVTDNTVVQQGSPLFRIEQTPFALAVEQAEARLAQAGQDIGASTASVDAAQAKVHEARAAYANVEAQTARDLELVSRGVLPGARADDAKAALAQAKAVVASAEADLRRAQEQLGPGGSDDPRLRDALAQLERARFDLSRTVVTAPARGVVTNLQLAGGQTVSAGHAAMTFISGEDVWLLAGIKENSLESLEPGQEADVVLDALPGRVFSATLRSVGWGIAGGSVDPSTGLPKSTQETGWLTESQRFPVQFVFDDRPLPTGPRYGSKAAVIVYTSGNPLMNAAAWLRIRLIALFTYVS